MAFADDGVDADEPVDHDDGDGDDVGGHGVFTNANEAVADDGVDVLADLEAGADDADAVRGGRTPIIQGDGG